MFLLRKITRNEVAINFAFKLSLMYLCTQIGRNGKNYWQKNTGKDYS